MKILKRVTIIISIIVLILFTSLAIYARNPYQSLEAMDIIINGLDDSTVTIIEDRDEISYNVSNPLKQIVFIPGGLVEPDSYKYLAIKLALEGYNVTIVKTIFNLPILTPNSSHKFLSNELDNIIIGHSLGGVVGSLVSSNNDLVDSVILLGSYPIKDLSDKKVLIITAEHDDGMDPDKFEASLKYLNEDAVLYNIEGGNHAQFGWYGPQKGDGNATITTLEQQNIVINIIIDFITQ